MALFAQQKSLLVRFARKIVWVGVAALLLAGGLNTHAGARVAAHEHGVAEHGAVMSDSADGHRHIGQGSTDQWPAADMIVHCGADILALSEWPSKHQVPKSGSFSRHHADIWRPADMGHDPPPPRRFS